LGQEVNTCQENPKELNASEYGTRNLSIRSWKKSHTKLRAINNYTEQTKLSTGRVSCFPSRHV
jgi:hypothetical protein